LTGDIGIGTGTSTPGARLEIRDTTEQLRVGYDASNYLSATINSTGSATFDLTGTSPEFTFSDAVNVPDEAYGAGWNGNTEVPTKNAVYDKIETLTGYTNLTQFVAQTAWRVFYSDGSGDVQELALGADGTFLKSNGAALAPSFATPAGSGDMVLADAQTNSGAKTFLDATMLLRNVANTFSSKFTNTNLAARTYTLKDADGTLAFTSDITGTNSGTNTGDQSIFQTIAVSGQSNVVADTTTDTLTLVAGTNITITTDAGADSITINARGISLGLAVASVQGFNLV
jgi:hypothetical protein